MIEENIKTTGFIVGALTFIAYIRQYLYYWYFNIEISNYLEFTEAFTAYLDELLIVGFVLFLIFYYVDSQNIKLSKKDPAIQSAEEKDIKETRYIYLFGALICVVSLVIKLISIQGLTRFNLLLLGCFAFVIVMMYLLRLKSLKRYSDKYPNAVIGLAILSLVVIYTVFLLVYEIGYKEYSEYRDKSYHFTLNDKTVIKTDSNVVYVGRTKSSLFIQYKKLNKISVINISNISNEDIIDIPSTKSSWSIIDWLFSLMN